jgi:hypothetical protein
MDNVLEDVGTAAMILYALGTPGLESVEYFITNINPGIPTVNNVGAFEDPIHDYDAFEITANKRLAENWSLISSYRYSQLEGNFEGFFRNDNGQSDPGITSLFDFPTNDPTYTQIGVPLFDWRGDIRNLGALGAGPLPNDRRHQIKILGTYVWNDLNIGLGFDASSGAPLTALAANPIYENSGEIPEGPRGSGIKTVDGQRERTPFRSFVDLHLDYPVRLGEQRLTLTFDAFNLFNNRDPDNYDYATESTLGAINPNGPIGPSGAQPLDGDVSSFPAFAAPFAAQFGVRFEW